MLWVTDLELGSPGFVMAFVEGETIPRRILHDDTYAGARTGMAARCGEILAGIHAIPVDDLDLEAPAGHPGRGALERYRGLLDAYGEPHPALELGARRLELSAPDPGRITLVHGDFRNGNLIVGPDGIRAVLDWELAHVSDPWEDLGWLVSRTWRFGGAGEVGGFGDREDLYRAYERASGAAVDRAAVAWWEAAAAFTWGVMCVVQSFVHLGGRSPSLEHAAIGRRAAEAEYDLLRLVAPEGS